MKLKMVMTQLKSCLTFWISSLQLITSQMKNRGATTSVMGKSLMKILIFLFIARYPINAQIRKEDGVIVEFQRDRIATVSSYLRFTGTVPEMKRFTACFRINLEQIRSSAPVLSYATDEYDNELLLQIYPKTNSTTQHYFDIYCCNNSTFSLHNIMELDLLDWNSFCISMDLISKDHTVVINGDVAIKRGKIFQNASDPKVAGGGIVYLGQEQDTRGGALNKLQSIRGQVADVYLLSSTTSELDMIKFTTCQKSYWNLQNLVMSLRNVSSNFELSNVEVRRIDDLGSLCRRKPKRIFILTGKRTADDSINTCKIVGGSLTTPINNEENEELFNLSAKHTKECLGSGKEIIWIGAKFDLNTKNIIDVDTNEVVKYKNFHETSISVNNSQSTCISFNGVLENNPRYYGKWHTTHCNDKKCTPCKFLAVKFLKMRGLCGDSYFDRYFYVVKENRSITFLGNKYSAINHIPPNESTPNNYGYWQMKRFDMPMVTAILKMKFLAHLPTGKNTWDIYNDNCGSVQSDLVLTICQSGEFSCSDGSCIPLNERCNLEANCPDASDENNCTKLIVEQTYSKELSPPRDLPDIPLQILLSVHINAVRSFQLDKFRITSEAVITTTWTDRRIKFKNLKNATILNNMQVGDSELWVPSFEILGNGNTSSDSKNMKYSLLARRESDPLPDDDQNFGEDEIFKGQDNRLVMEKKVQTTTACSFELVTFPFDIQICEIIIVMTDTASNYAEFVLNNGSLRFGGERKLLEYYVSSVTWENFPIKPFSGVKIKIVFANLFLYYMTSTYIPTSIMLIIGGSTFFFPIKDFNDRVMVSLTSLLVEAALFSQISESIPKTSYLKFIDIWFVFCMIYLFMINICVTMINYIYFSEDSKLGKGNSVSPTRSLELFMNNQGKDKGSRRNLAVNVNKKIKFIFSTIFLLFVIVYSVMAANSLHGADLQVIHGYNV